MNVIHKYIYIAQKMIIINKSGYLKYKKLKFRCVFGKAGIGKKKEEGDNITPRGVYQITKIFYRKDRIKNITTKFRLTEIKKNMGWCDDSRSKNYNQLIKLPSKFSHENLFRKDSLYDLILVLNYNMRPITKNKGSAIFIHIAQNNYERTAGCVAIKKNNLIELLSKINKKVKIKIN